MNERNQCNLGESECYKEWHTINKGTRGASHAKGHRTLDQ